MNGSVSEICIILSVHLCFDVSRVGWQLCCRCAGISSGQRKRNSRLVAVRKNAYRARSGVCCGHLEEKVLSDENSLQPRERPHVDPILVDWSEIVPAECVD